MILLIDNYDSFVHNLARYFTQLGHATLVVRNDAQTVEEALHSRPEAIVVSPGPCGPDQAGISVELIRAATGHVPILGICLGHQAIGMALGAKIKRGAPCHGQASMIYHDGQTEFHNLPNPLSVGRYHSLVVDEPTLPTDLAVTCRTQDGIVMGLRHRRHKVVGWQFHPESILTPQGYQLLSNFLTWAELPCASPLPKLEKPMEGATQTSLKQSLANDAFDWPLPISNSH